MKILFLLFDLLFVIFVCSVKEGRKKGLVASIFLFVSFFLIGRILQKKEKTIFSEIGESENRRRERERKNKNRMESQNKRNNQFPLKIEKIGFVSSFFFFLFQLFFPTTKKEKEDVENHFSFVDVQSIFFSPFPLSLILSLLSSSDFCFFFRKSFPKFTILKIKSFVLESKKKTISKNGCRTKRKVFHLFGEIL